MTVPAPLRRKHRMNEGVRVKFEESARGLIIKSLPDIVDSAGKLSSYAEAGDVIKDLLLARQKGFR